MSGLNGGVKVGLIFTVLWFNQAEISTLINLKMI